MTGIVYIEALETTMVSCLSSERFFLKNILNPLMIPCLKSGEGGFQDATITIDAFAVTVKLLGAFDGTEIFQMQQRQEVNQNKRFPWNEIKEK